MTTGSPPCITDTTEFVVPRSIPIILLIVAVPPVRIQMQDSGKGSGPSKTSVIVRLECAIVKYYFNSYNTLLIISLRLDSQRLAAAIHHLKPLTIESKRWPVPGASSVRFPSLHWGSLSSVSHGSSPWLPRRWQFDAETGERDASILHRN